MNMKNSPNKMDRLLRTMVEPTLLVAADEGAAAALFGVIWKWSYSRFYTTRLWPKSRCLYTRGVWLVVMVEVVVVVMGVGAVAERQNIDRRKMFLPQQCQWCRRKTV